MPSEDIATSQQAYELYNSAVEDWGDAEHDQIARLCRWSESVYRVKLACPKP